jgi:hypothetical protein
MKCCGCCKCLRINRATEFCYHSEKRGEKLWRVLLRRGLGYGFCVGYGFVDGTCGTWNVSAPGYGGFVQRGHCALERFTLLRRWMGALRQRPGTGMSSQPEASVRGGSIESMRL